MAYTFSPVGTLIKNAPVTPNNAIDLLDNGSLCKCDCSAEAGAYVNYTIEITFSAAPALDIIDALEFVDNNGDNTDKILDKQYLFNADTPDPIVENFVADLKKIFGQYISNGGGLAFDYTAGVLTMTLTAQAPFVPTALYVNNAAVAFTIVP